MQKQSKYRCFNSITRSTKIFPVFCKFVPSYMTAIDLKYLFIDTIGTIQKRTI